MKSVRELSALRRQARKERDAEKALRLLHHPQLRELAKEVVPSQLLPLSTSVGPLRDKLLPHILPHYLGAHFALAIVRLLHPSGRSWRCSQLGCTHIFRTNHGAHWEAHYWYVHGMVLAV